MAAVAGFEPAARRAILRLLVAGLGVCAAFMHTGCERSLAQADRPVGGFTGREWQLQRLITEGREIPLPPHARVSITFSAEGTVSGHGGVNSFSAGYRSAEADVTWTTPFRTTRKAGPKELQELETTFLAVLQHSAKLIAGDTTLTLTGSHGTLTFAAAPRPPR